MKFQLQRVIIILLVLLGLTSGPINKGEASPSTLDPFVFIEQKVFAPEGFPRDSFGVSVAISEDTAFVGAYAFAGAADQGSVYIYTRSGGTWELAQKLVAPDGTKNDGFGISVAVSGDSLLVGSLLGSAYVFTRSGPIWTQQAQLTMPNGKASTFGGSVALSGDTALVGAYTTQVGDSIYQGAAYIFTRDQESWNMQQMLIAPDGMAHDGFGFSVALSGDTAVVGAYQDRVGTNSGQGSVYVFTGSGSDWTEQSKLTASDGAANDWFGTSVAFSGNTVLVGVPGADVGDNLEQGAAYVFTRSDAVWTQESRLIASIGEAGDSFGASVAVISDTAVVGTEFADVGGNVNQGLVYVFTRNGTSWMENTHLAASDGAAYDWFGVSVAISSHTVMVGAFGATIKDTIGQGAAYIYEKELPFLTFLPALLKSAP